MPFSDLPMPVLFLLFLIIFVLPGLYPAGRRTAAKLRELLRERAGEKSFPFELEDESPVLSAVRTEPESLDDFELMVLRCLAQDGDKGMTVRQIDANLFLGRETIGKALKELIRAGMVFVAISMLFRFRFYLSEQGRAYAIEHEYIPEVHAPDRRSEL